MLVFGRKMRTKDSPNQYCGLCLAVNILLTIRLRRSSRRFESPKHLLFDLVYRGKLHLTETHVVLEEKKTQNETVRNKKAN